MLAYRDVVKLVAQRSSTRHVGRGKHKQSTELPTCPAVHAVAICGGVRVLFLSGELLLHPQEAFGHVGGLK